MDDGISIILAIMLDIIYIVCYYVFTLVRQVL